MSGGPPCTYRDLAGRRVLVTGASSGIGQAIAEAFLEQGARVAIGCRTQRDAAEALAARAPDRTVVVPGDLAIEADVVRVVQQCGAAFGGLDAVVHAAGIWEDGALATLTGEALERMFRVNVFSAFFLAREAVKQMPGRGSLLFIGSTAGERGEPRHSPYAASKAALFGLVQSLAQELGPGIRANLLSPGWVLTPMAAKTLVPETERRVTSWIPDRRLGTVQDCAQAALFLTSDVSSHLVGIDLPVSGGALLPIPAR